MGHQVLQATFANKSHLDVGVAGNQKIGVLPELCCAVSRTQPSLSNPQFSVSGITMLTSYQMYWQANANSSTVNTNPYLRTPI